MTVLKLAREAGVSPNTITNAERGRSRLSDASASKLARALGVGVDEIIERPGQYRPTDDDSPLRRRRHRLGLSSREAAERIGVSRSALIRAETGARVHPRNAERIAGFFGVSASEFIGVRPPMATTTTEDA